MIRNKTSAIIVTYNPEFRELNKLIGLVLDQVSNVIIVDNNSKYPIKEKIKSLPLTNEKIIFVALSENLGIAKAQNIGIEKSKEYNPDFLVFFDQDSEPSKDMLYLLIKAYINLSIEEPKIGILGPRYLDPRQNNPPPFLKFKGLRMIRCSCDSNNSIVEVDYLISSGSIISSKALAEIGMMRDDFFIDYVDIEWGLRAKFKGFKNYGICNALMNHNLGDTPQKFFKKNIPIHSPLRHYYHFRNAILLYRENWVPLNWKIVDCFRLFLKFVYYSLFTKSRLEHLHLITKGIFHGIINNKGKLKS